VIGGTQRTLERSLPVVRAKNFLTMRTNPQRLYSLPDEGNAISKDARGIRLALLAAEVRHG
jgi:hypothetical protein